MIDKIVAIMNMTEKEIREHPGMMVCAFNREERILFWNKQCEAHFHIKEDELLGKRLTDLVPELESNKKWEHLRKALKGQPLYLAKEKFERKQGMYDHIFIPISDKDGNIEGALSIIIDITNLHLGNGTTKQLSLPHELLKKSLVN